MTQCLEMPVILRKRVSLICIIDGCGVQTVVVVVVVVVVFVIVRDF